MTHKKPPICDQIPPSNTLANPTITQTHRHHKPTNLGPKIHHQTHWQTYPQHKSTDPKIWDPKSTIKPTDKPTGPPICNPKPTIKPTRYTNPLATQTHQFATQNLPSNPPATQTHHRDKPPQPLQLRCILASDADVHHDVARASERKRV